MAKYTVKFACGHGEHIEQLVGKTVDRERRIAWMEINHVCPDCYRQKSETEDAAADRIVFVDANGTDTTITLRISGAARVNADALKALGYRWSREYGGVLGLLATREPPLALVRRYQWISDEELATYLLRTADELAPLGYRMINNIGPLDRAMWRLTLAKIDDVKEARALAAAHHPKPPRPEWYQAMLSEAAKEAGRPITTNGKIYGSGGKWTIYINNRAHRLTDVQAAELRGYQAARAAHLKAVQEASA